MRYSNKPSDNRNSHRQFAACYKLSPQNTIGCFAEVGVLRHIAIIFRSKLRYPSRLDNEMSAQHPRRRRNPSVR